MGLQVLKLPNCRKNTFQEYAKSEGKLSDDKIKFLVWQMIERLAIFKEF